MTEDLDEEKSNNKSSDFFKDIDDNSRVRWYDYLMRFGCTIFLLGLFFQFVLSINSIYIVYAYKSATVIALTYSVFQNFEKGTKADRMASNLIPFIIAIGSTYLSTLIK